MRRVLGRDHFDTLLTSTNLATALSRQDKHAEAAAIEREVLVSRTRLLGAEHENTLLSASNLAHSLSECGQKMEVEQLLRNTLVLARRALGSTHERTAHVFAHLRELAA